MMIALIIYFFINLILAVILTIAKSKEIRADEWWSLVIYAVVMLLFGLPIVVVGFLWVWIVGLIAKKHGEF